MTAAGTARVQFPAGAFGLGIILFSADMREAFVSGILVVLVSAVAAVAGELLKGMLPGWSLRGVLLIFAGTLSACGFELSFYTLGMGRSVALSVMTGVIGLLAAVETIGQLELGGTGKSGANRTGADKPGKFDDLLWECSVVWALWIAVGILREFLTSGTVFGFGTAELPIFSGSFQKPMFGFLGAGVVLGISCMILGKTCRGLSALLVVVPAVLYTRPFSFDGLGETVGALAAAAVTLGFFLSVRKQQQDTTRKAALDGLPAELISIGILYMILSVYQ